MFKVLRNGLLRYILHTCPKLWCNPCSKSYGMNCFGIYTSLLMFWTFDLREQVCIFGMNVEIYAMALFSLVLVLFDFSLVFALVCPLSGITFIDTSLQNLQIFICLHHIEIWLGDLSNDFQRCTLVTRTWPWMMVNEHRLQLSQQHGFTKEAMRKKFIQVWSSVSHYTTYTFVLSKTPWSIFSPKTIVAFVSYMCGR